MPCLGDEEMAKTAREYRLARLATSSSDGASSMSRNDVGDRRKHARVGCRGSCGGPASFAHERSAGLLDGLVSSRPAMPLEARNRTLESRCVDALRRPRQTGRQRTAFRRFRVDEDHRT
jgi:hypothetical protein